MATTAVTETRVPARPSRWQSLAKRQSLIGTILVILALPFIFRMDPANFQVFLLPGTWRFLGEGVLFVVVVSAVAIVISLPLSTLFALGRLSNKAWVRWPSILYIEIIRSLPLLLVIFYIFLHMPPAIPDFVSREALALTSALVVYTVAVTAEIIRSGILSLDRGQSEAARSLGLTYFQSMRYIILPQTFRLILPALIAQFTILLKDTSLGSIIGMVELTQRGKIIFQGSRNPMETFYIVAILYFVLNYVLEQISIRIERGRGHRAVPPDVQSGALERNI